MGKQTQQTISRFFTAKPRTDEGPSMPSSQPTVTKSNVTAIASFSPSKRKLLSSKLSHRTQRSSNKRLKTLHSPHTNTPIPSNSSSVLHQRFVEKLLEPPPSGSDCGTQLSHELCISAKYTPLEQQVVELKKKYPDVLLMVEVGYKYRFFGDDAAIASRVLGIYSHVDHNFLTASVPTFRLNVHVRRLVSEGYKVGVVKQTETAAIKAHGDNKSGPFHRGLSALYTKATLEAAEDMGGAAETCGAGSSYLCCVVEKCLNLEKVVEMDSADVRIGAVSVEISTGDVVYCEFDDGFLRSGLESILLSLSPSELLLANPISKSTEKLLLSYAGPASNVRVERVLNCFSDGGAVSEMVSLFQTLDEDVSEVVVGEALKKLPDQGTSTFALDVVNMPELAVQALALLTRHLRQFGFERIISLGASFRSFSNSTEMNLSANTLQQLEILCSNSNGSETGSLLYIMNQTLTIYGSRLMKYWVTHPLTDRNLISDRLDAVSEIAEWMGFSGAYQYHSEGNKLDECMIVAKPDFYCLFSNVFVALGRLPDVQRGISRIYHRTASPKEFIQVFQALLYAGVQLRQLHTVDELDNNKMKHLNIKSSLLKRLLSSASSAGLVRLTEDLLSVLNKDSAEKGDLTNLFIVTGSQFSEVETARKKVQMVKEDLDSLIHVYRKRPRMKNVDFMSVSGTTHLIELPLDFEVPADWIKVNSTKKMIRYHPQEVVMALESLSLANEELMVISKAAWGNFLKGFARHYTEFQGAVHALAALDCLHSLATLSRNKNYVRPEFVQSNEPAQIRIASGRHPVLETLLPDTFVPNDTELLAEREYCQIVTGPNMGGKSCYIRQVALLSLMAQVGSYIPASSAVLHVLDNIYTRMGASDSIQQGRSTFLEELSECSSILNKCTSRSLVIIDELGRGTSTHDGTAIAFATLHHLLGHKKCLVLFVTHYPKIADIRNEFPQSVGTYHVSYLTSEKNKNAMRLDSEAEDVTYLYKLVPGLSDKSFAFKVAELAQLPAACIKRAAAMSMNMEALVQSRINSKKMHLMKQQEGSHSCNFAAPYDAYAEVFSCLRLVTLRKTPSECINLLTNAMRLARELCLHPLD